MTGNQQGGFVKRAVWLLCVLLPLLVACGKSDHTGKKAQDSGWPIVWLYPDGSCQNTRTRFLVAHRANLIQWADPMSCTLASGTWQSWGRSLQVGLGQAMVVPLVTPQDAVESGAKDWTRKQQIAFINDMDNLIILDPVSLAERKNDGPDKWIPIPQFRCEYGRHWKLVKERYHLSMTKAEEGAVAALIAMCPKGQVFP
jgi:hypothetical protein